MNLDHLSTMLSILGPGLKNHLWQSSMFAAGAVLVTLGMRKNFARTRYWVFLAASIKFLVPFSILMTAGSALLPRREPASAGAAVYDFIGVVSQPFSTSSATSLLVSHNGTIKQPELSWSVLVPLLLGIIWLLGTLSILAAWGLYWWRLRSVIRRAPRVVNGPEIRGLRELQEKGWVSASVELRLSETNLAPGIYGMMRPTLLWPTCISERLNSAQIEAILAHELCHIERRDNLTACIHMAVEALFWFHPLVWWLGSRLELERERACDERVLQLIQTREIYAESILKVCEMCLESSLACVSGVTGADLKERIRRIMTGSLGQRLTLRGKALLTIAALGSVALPIVFGQVANHPSVQVQDGTPSSKQSFEVATIKPVENGPKTPRFIKLEGRNRFVVRDYNLKLLIAAAYNMNPKTISGGPDWIESDYYDIQALAPGQTSPNRDAQMAMLRQLLEDRFKLTFHREPKEFSIYALEVTRDGSKLKPSDLGPADPSSVGPGMVYPQKIVMPARNATMGDFAALLQRAVLDRPVVDMTGLTGRYDFSLEWAPDETQFGGELPAASEDAPSPPLFQAVQQQLGLKLDARKGPVAAIVIDRVEHPTPN